MPFAFSIVGAWLVFLDGSMVRLSGNVVDPKMEPPCLLLLIMIPARNSSFWYGFMVGFVCVGHEFMTYMCVPLYALCVSKMDVERMLHARKSCKTLGP